MKLLRSFILLITVKFHDIKPIPGILSRRPSLISMINIYRMGKSKKK